MTMTNTMPQTTPRSLEVLIQHVRTEAPCPHCKSLAGVACAWQGRRGVHISRFIQAYTRQLITAQELMITFGLLSLYARKARGSASVIRNAR